MALLEHEYQRNSNWSTARITQIAKRLKLNRTKIYKWSWDRKKKEAEEQANMMPDNGQWSHRVKTASNLAKSAASVQIDKGVFNLRH